MPDDDRAAHRDGPPPDDPAATRADLLPEEKVAGSDDPEAQAEAILAESAERIATRDAPTGNPVEHRTSNDATPPVT